MTNLAAKLIAGSSERKTRLHAETGEQVSLGRLIRNGPRSLVTGLGRVLFGWRPQRPWISYDAQEVIEAHLTPQSRVLEFGSGMSTLWFAKRAGSVYSIETDPSWYARMKAMLPGNAAIALAQTREEYLSFPEQPYDFIMVDGRWRNRCIDAALPFLAPGGILYLDNSDREKYQAGIRAMHAHAEQHGGEVRRYVDFIPATFFAIQGTMLRAKRG